jgi:hypothetical protein
MLFARYYGFEQELRLHIRYEGAEAWIAQVPRRFPEQRNWQIWVRPKPGLPARAGKSSLRLVIESRLRAWLLRRYRRCLYALDFAALRGIAEGHGVRPKGPMSEF